MGVWSRLVFLPLFLVMPFEPKGITRTLPVLIENDWVFWAAVAVLGVTSGYYSSLAMMNAPR